MTAKRKSRSAAKRKLARKLAAGAARKTTPAKKAAKRSRKRTLSNAARPVQATKAPTQPSLNARTSLRRTLRQGAAATGAPTPSAPAQGRVLLRRVAAATPLAGALPAPSSGPALSSLPSRESVAARILGKLAPGR